MKRKTRISGVDVTISDGDKETDDIIDCSDCPELNAEAELERLEFVKRQVKGFAGEYHLVDKKGNVIV
jgi:hypothetical protein